MKTDRKTIFTVGASIFLLYLCIRYWDPFAMVLMKCLAAAMPLLLGCVIAYVVNILMTFYERCYFPNTTKRWLIRSRRPICLTAAFLSLIAVIALIVGLIVPQLVSCVTLLAAAVPDVIEDLLVWIGEKDLLTDKTLSKLTNIDWASIVGSVSKWLTSGLGSVIDIVINTVTAVISGVVTAFVAIIFSLYLLAGKERLARQSDRIMRRYIKPKPIDKIEYVLRILNDCFHRYIVGQCTEALILGVLCLIGMLILKLPYATMISALIAFTALIPIAGAYIGAAVGSFMILTVSPPKALIFLIFLVILQQLEGNLIYPKVVGSSMELPALWVLAAVTVGGGVLGIPGMLLGVPITAAAYRILKADVEKGEKGEKTNQKSDSTEDPKETKTPPSETK